MLVRFIQAGGSAWPLDVQIAPQDERWYEGLVARGHMIACDHHFTERRIVASSRPHGAVYDVTMVVPDDDKESPAQAFHRFRGVLSKVLRKRALDEVAALEPAPPERLVNEWRIYYDNACDGLGGDITRNFAPLLSFKEWLQQ